MAHNYCHRLQCFQNQSFHETCHHYEESLFIEAAPDVLMGDQTWPLDDEMQDADPSAGRNRRNVPRDVNWYWFSMPNTYLSSIDS